MFALIGVLGTVGTLVGQHLATRIEVQCDRQQRTGALRAELKEALAAAQRGELILDHGALGLSAPEDAQDEKLHDLWLVKKAVELVCSHEMAQAAYDYTKALHAHLRNTVTPEQVSNKRDYRYACMEAARAALGSGRPRVQRWSLTTRRPLLRTAIPIFT
ncbi:hypothetical protein ACIBAI_22800 [Streptomyces sp. NPDC051041]|uniref:hypothetical protein n=1 Tax=Streptomyces sp. NPDC051041 TaxID=3365640 RepID=UPI0037A4CD13